jgi:hypothetical protein
VTITVLDHPFDQWRLDHFGQAANLPSAAADADPDSDGVENLLEHVLQTQPLRGMDAGVLPTGIIVDRRFGLRALCPTSPGVRLEIQRSSTLDSWQTVATRQAGAAEWALQDPTFTLAAGPAQGEIRALAPAGNAPMFLRLAATRN